jgi:hypothetical protein
MKKCVWCAEDAELVDEAVNAVLCGPACQNAYYAISEVAIPCIKNVRSGEVVVTPSGFVMIRVQQMDENELFAIAKQYLKEKNLPWNIRKPHSWTDYKAGPHVSLDKKMAKYSGEKVEVEIGTIFHFSSESNWVAVHAKLPPKFLCPFGCHISIGQQRL